VDPETRIGGDAAAFPATRWTAVLGARSGEAVRENLDSLIRVYWKPVYRFIRFEWSKSNEEAKDLAQAFFASLLERESLREVAPEKGRFRSFLKAALRNFLLQAKRDAGRLKRKGALPAVCPEDLPDLKAATPEEAFDREWAHAVLDAALERLREDLRDGEAFELFREFYFGDGERLSYEQLAEKHGMKKFDVGNRLKAARARFREIALALIRDTVLEGGDPEAEFRELFGGGL
jgi:RNA polymerase sigma factor (sigma-70 family)